MKNSKKSLILILAIIAVVMTALIAATLITAVVTEYDVSIGHFAADAVFAPASYLIMGVGFVLSVVGAALTGKAKIKPGKNAGAFLSFASVFAAILLAAASVFDLVGNVVRVDEGYNSFLYLTVVSGVLGAVALFMFAVNGSYRTGMSMVLSMCLPLYFIIRTLVLYFDRTGAINSPVKVLTQLAFVSFALFAIFDTGIYIGRDKILPRFVMSSILAVTIGGGVSISALVTQFVYEGCFELSVVDTCMVLAFFVLVCAKIYNVAFSVCDVAEEEKVEVKEEAAEAAEEVTEETTEEIAEEGNEATVEKEAETVNE